MIFGALLLSFAIALVSLTALIPSLRRAGRVGRDLHKPSQPEIPEMGGLALLLGWAVAIGAVLVAGKYSGVFPGVDQTALLASLATVLGAGLIGCVDDMLGMRQSVKAFLPWLVALPLAAASGGKTAIVLPFVGVTDFGLVSPLVLVPLGVTVAANASNMLAGFNGLEAGIGLISLGTLAVIAGVLGRETALVLLLAGIGGVGALLALNRYPAKVLIGDVGTLSIGALIACGAVVGRMETAGALLFLPHVVDFVLKAVHRFPTSGWGGVIQPDGRLVCPPHGPVSLPQLVLKLTGGLHERTLVAVLWSVQLALGVLAAGLVLCIG